MDGAARRVPRSSSASTIARLASSAGRPSNRPELTSFPSSSITISVGSDERLGELAVALVVRGDGHDRACSVVRQDVVGDPDRQPFAVDRVDHVLAGEDAGLGRRPPRAPRPAARRRGARTRFTSSLACSATNGCSGATTKNVAPKSVSARVVKTGTSTSDLLDAEEDLGAFGAADPVALDRLRPLGPEAALRQVVLEQLVGVRGHPDVPLRHVPELDLRAAALAAAVDDVLVGDDRLVVGAPVDRPLPAVAEVVRDELQEQPLRPAVEGRLVRCDLALPVDRPAQPLHLGAHRLDVPVDRLPRMAPLADRGVLGRQPERVPAHRPHDVPAAPPANVGRTSPIV